MNINFLQGAFAPSSETGLVFPLPIIYDGIAALRHDIFSITPIIFLLLTCYNLLLASNNVPNKKRSPYLLGLKLTTAGCLIITESTAAIASLVDVALQQNQAAATISFITAVGLLNAVAADHLYSATSTDSMAISLISALASDSIRMQRFSFQPTNQLLHTLARLAFGFKCALLVLNEFPKKSPQKKSSNAPVRKTDVIQYNNTGLMNPQPLNSSSIKLKIPNEDASSPSLPSKALLINFKKRWKSVKSETSFCLLWTILRTLAIPLIMVLLLKLVHSAFTMSQVTLLKRFFAVMDLAEDLRVHKENLTAIAVFTYVGAAISRRIFTHVQSRSAKRMQVVLETAAHSKLMSLSSSDIQSPETATIVNSDIKNIMDNIFLVCGVIGDVTEVVMCANWLAQSLGSLAIVFEIAIVSHVMLYRYLHHNFDACRQAMDESTSARVAKASTMLAKVKAFQITVTADAVLEEHKVYRDHEVRQCTSLYFISVPAILGTLYITSQGHQITAQDAFPILLIVYLNFDALRKCGHNYSNIKSMLRRLNRVQGFFFVKEALNFDASQETSSLVVKARDDQTGRIPGCICMRNQEHEKLQYHHSPTSTKSRTKSRVINVQNASLTVDFVENAPIITNLTLSVQRHQLVMVAGPMGSGKSILLRSFIKDSILQRGILYQEPGIVGFCDQQPWLQHASIRQNIVGRENFDLNWYTAVLEACLLIDDINALPDSDQTIIGTNASNLSYGQEHKVALARALYMKPPYLVLDGVFGTFDYDTSNSMFERIFGPGGLLKNSPSTVLLTTHSKTLLNKADKVVLMNDKKRATVYNDLNSARFHQHLNNITLPDEVVDSSAIPHRETTSEPLGVKDSSHTINDDFGFFDELYKYLGEFKRTDLVFYMFYFLLSALGVSLREYGVHQWITLAPDNIFFFIGYNLFLAFTCIAMLQGVRLWFVVMLPDAANQLYHRLLDHTMQANIGYLSHTPHHILLSLYDSEMQCVTYSMPYSFLNIAHHGVTIVVQLVLITVLTNYSFSVLSILLVGMSIAVVRYSRSARPVESATQRNKIAQDGHLEQTISGVRHIRAFGWQPHTLQKSTDLSQASQTCAFETESLYGWLEFILDLTKGTATISVFFSAMFGDNSLSVSIAGVLAIVILICTDNYVFFVRNLAIVRSCLGSFCRMNRAMEEMLPKQKPSLSATDLPDRWPLVGSVGFYVVTACYDAKARLPPVLKMMTITIPPGHKVAIVGRTGSGKSSVLLSLLNFLDCHGSIQIDGTDISNLPNKYLRQQITTISTDVIELQGTVRTNLCPWITMMKESDRSLPMHSIRLILRSLRLWTLLQRQGGLDKDIASLDLNNRERKLLSVARGMLRNIFFGGNVVIMDETASELDPRTQLIVHNTLKQVFNDHTIIRVMSCPDMLKDMDTIIRLIDGRIAEVRTNPHGPAAVKALAKAKAKYIAQRKRFAGPARRPPPPPPPPRMLAPSKTRRPTAAIVQREPAMESSRRRPLNVETDYSVTPHPGAYDEAIAELRNARIASMQRMNKRAGYSRNCMLRD